MKSARIPLVAVVALIGLACGDAVGPTTVRSDHVAIEARIAPGIMSLSSTTDSVVVVVSVRNRLPWRAAVHLRGADPAEHIWWSVRVGSDTSAVLGRFALINSFGELALDPHQVVERRIVLRPDFFDGFTPGTYVVHAGLGYDQVRAGSLVVSP